MLLLLAWALVAIVATHICSLLETVLFSVSIATLVDRKLAGSAGAARLLDIKRHRGDDAIGAVVIANTTAGTLGTTLAGAQASRVFGGAYVGVFSAGLIVILLVVSEIVPKTFAARHAGSMSGFAGNAFTGLIRVTGPLLRVTGWLARLIARRPREQLTRRELAIVVGGAPRAGAISTTEAELIGHLIYSRDVTLQDVMTPLGMVFMLPSDARVGRLLTSQEADAFSRIPLFSDSQRQIVGYVAHRDVLKALALGGEPSRPLADFLRPIPVLPAALPVGKGLERLMDFHEAIALVSGDDGTPTGIVTLEDLIEALLGMEITDEAEMIEKLRPAVRRARHRRALELKRRRSAQLPSEP